MNVPNRQLEDPLHSPRSTLFPVTPALQPLVLTFLPTLDPGQAVPRAQTQEVHYSLPPGDGRQPSLGAGLQRAGAYAGHYLHAAGLLVFKGRQSMFEVTPTEAA